jgi:hypothetical protein
MFDVDDVTVQKCAIVVMMMLKMCDGIDDDV